MHVSEHNMGDISTDETVMVSDCPGVEQAVYNWEPQDALRTNKSSVRCV